MTYSIAIRSTLSLLMIAFLLSVSPSSACDSTAKAPRTKPLDPVGYLAFLKNRLKTENPYTPLFGPNVRRVNEKDIPKLIDLLDSKHKCAATMKPGSAYAGTDSTVGHEASVLIDSFRLGRRYPIANTSTLHKVDHETIRRWWTSFRENGNTVLRGSTNATTGP
jgi:hypothetical protein